MRTVHLVSKPMERARAGFLADLLSELAWPEASAVSLAKADEARDFWQVEVYYAARPDCAALAAALTASGFSGDELVEEPLPEVDWVAESLKGLEPVSAGRFFIHGSHDRHRRPLVGISVEIDAGVAFGTGHHGTTQGCLLAMECLARTWRPRRVLDVGTGTGVLAIAAARLWRVPVLASDIDPVAVRTARENARRNNVGPFIRFLVASGTRHPEIRRRAPHDLVLANILAGPLRRMAGDLAQCMAPDGRLVLSGLLRGQENAVLAAFRAHGLWSLGRIRLGEWSTLLLGRGGAARCNGM